MGQIKKRVRHQVIIDYFYSVNTFYVPIDDITTNFDHRLNFQNNFFQNFACLDLIIILDSFLIIVLPLEKTCQMNIGQNVKAFPLMQSRSGQMSNQ